MIGYQTKKMPVLRDKIKPAKLRLNGWCMISLAILAVCLALVFVARQNPWLVEKIYSRSVYPLIAHTFGRIMSLIPVSMVELIILAAVGGILFFLIRYIMLLFRPKRRAAPRQNTARMLSRLVIEISLLVSVFILFCGLNYYRPTYTEMSGLIVRDSSVEELVALCAELTSRANELAPQVRRDERGVATYSQNIWALCQQSREEFGNLAEKYPVLPDFPITPKPVLFSPVMSMTQITGFFCPITFEANVNAAAPDFTIAFTICHELAHTRGFMREDEANFIGYLACTESQLPEFQYSGVMMALIHVQGRLYDANQEAFRLLREKCSDLVLNDMWYNDAYWINYEGVVAEVSSAVNNTYLQMNNQRDGVHSYGRMVDLLLADYRQRHDLK